MPIEFRCDHCQRLLRTPDASAGKQARCPECGKAMPVPLDDTRAQAAPPGGESIDPFAAGANPHHSFGSADYSHPDAVLPADGITPAPVDLEEVWSIAWRLFKRRLSVCLLATLTLLFVNWLLGGAIAAITFPDWRPNAPLPLHKLTPASAAGVLIYAAASVYFATGMQFFMLKIARDQPAGVADLFKAGPWLASSLAAYVLFGLSFTVGSFLIVGGLVVLAFLWPFSYLILDRNLGPIEALTTAASITRGNRLAAILNALLLLLLGMIALFCSCGVAGIFFFPYAQLLLAVFYLKMTGQPTGAG